MTTRYFRYARPFRDLCDSERWCEQNDLAPVVLERGPDGLIRGITEIPAPDDITPGGDS